MAKSTAIKLVRYDRVTPLNGYPNPIAELKIIRRSAPPRHITELSVTILCRPERIPHDHDWAISARGIRRYTSKASKDELVIERQLAKASVRQTEAAK